MDREKLEKLRPLALKAMRREEMTQEEKAELDTLTREFFKLPENDRLDFMLSVDVDFLLNPGDKAKKSLGE